MSTSSTATVPDSGSPSSAMTFTSFNCNLAYGMTGADVRTLQVFLNRLGYTVAVSGRGSPGSETTHFGSNARRAVIRFQEAYRVVISYPIKPKSGTGDVGTNTRAVLNELLSTPPQFCQAMQ